MIEFNFNMPDQIVFGNGKINDLADIIKPFGKNVLFFAEKSSFKESGAVLAYEKYAQAAGDNVSIIETYDEPTVDYIEKILSQIDGRAADVIVAVGGGSCLDTAKIVSAVAASGTSLAELINGELPRRGSAIPLITVPILASTGSEVTSTAVISSFTLNPFKKVLKTDSMMPKIAVIDPNLYRSASPELTVLAAFNIFGQIIQSYTSVKSTSLTDVFMLEGLSSVYGCLKSLKENEIDDTLYEKLAYSSMISGIGVENSSLTIINGLANAIGGLYNIPHSEITAAIAYQCVLFNMRRVQFFEANIDTTLKYARIGSVMSGIEYSYDKKDVLLRAVSAGIMETSKKLNLPTLSKLGVKKEDFYKIISSTDQSGNPIEIADTEINEILESCY